MHMLLQSLSTGSHDALSHKRLYLCLVSKVGISSTVLDELTLGQGPQSLDGVEMARVGRVVVKHQVIVLSLFCDCWAVVRIQVVQYHVSSLLVHPSTQLDQELHEVALLDRHRLEQ